MLESETLRQIALELVDAVRKNASIDWTVKESVRAKMRAIVKRILRAHGYPPDKRDVCANTNPNHYDQKRRKQSCKLRKVQHPHSQ